MKRLEFLKKTIVGSIAVMVTPLIFANKGKDNFILIPLYKRKGSSWDIAEATIVGHMVVIPYSSHAKKGKIIDFIRTPQNTIPRSEYDSLIGKDTYISRAYRKKAS